MNYKIEHISKILQAARKKKKLSQRALGTKVGIPQSHISKIENAEVDLQTSSLIEIARNLDLELMLIPRTLVPLVKGLQRNADSEKSTNRQIPAYRLDDVDIDEDESEEEDY